MRRLVVSVTALSLALMVGSTALHSNPPKPPPDIQAIIDKQKHGGRLTADDIAKLQAWASGVVQHLPANLPEPPHGGSADTSTDAIPVRFDVTAHYERKTTSGTEEFDIDAWAPMRLTAKIAGTDDYVRGMLDPKAKTSSFYFQPAPTYGEGSYRYHAVTDGKTDLTASISHFSGAVMFATVGGDGLGIVPGTLGGDVKGTYHTVDKQGKSHSHAYEGTMQEWRPDLLFPWEGHVTKDRTQPVAHPRAQISYRKLVAAAQSDKPTQLEITEHFDWHDHGESVTGDITVKLSFHPQPQPEVRIIADSDWANWKPEGETPKSPGNEFTVHLAVVDSETGKPIVDKKMQVASASFELNEVSHLPGVCGNYPPKGASSSSDDKQPDLRFSTKNTGTVPDAPRQTLQLDHTNWNAPVIVESRDFAAYGKLTAKVTLQDGREIDAKFMRTVEPTITVTEVTLPRDDDNNKIADAWQDHLGMDPKADDEDTPQGMATQGDGLTVMEEYRGFLVSEHRNAIPANDEKHVRLSATQRELFVIKEVDDPNQSVAVETGIALFEKIAQMRVLAVASMDRLTSRTNDVGVRKRGVVTYAQPDGSTSADADMGTMGVWITAKLPPPPSIARTEPLLDDLSDLKNQLKMFGSPARIRYVLIGSPDEAKGTLDLLIKLVDPVTDSCCPNTAERDDEYYKDYGITPHQRVAAAKYARAHYADLLAEMNAFSVAHELGHAIGATHHGMTNPRDASDKNDEYDTTGDDTCPMRYWQLQRTHGTTNAGYWVDFLSGKWNPLVSSPHGPWKFCAFNMPQLSVKSR